MVAVQPDDHFVCLQVGDHLVLLVHHLEGDVGGDGRGGGEQGGEEGPIKMGAGAVNRTFFRNGRCLTSQQSVEFQFEESCQH